MSNTVKTIANAMQDAAKDKTTPYDSTATVKRVEGNTAWVHIPGGVDETPVRMTIAAKPGDSVQVRVSGGSAFLVGNGSAPPTDDATANTAIYIAGTAKDEASTAHTAALEAVSSAIEAKEAATSAKTSANEAKRSADEANTQATYATNYANNALTQLSTVESVVDALTWISEHSVFIPTTDTTVQTSKLYYLPANNVLPIDDGTVEYSGMTFSKEAGVITVNGTASEFLLYSVGVPNVTTGDTIYISGCSGGTSSTYDIRYGNGPGSYACYDGTTKATATEGKQIYIKFASGYTATDLVFTPTVSTANDGFEYKIVQSPTGNPSAQGWYELSTDEAVKTYVQTHLALTNDGLYVLNDSSAYKMLLANDGMYIQAPNGQTVNQSTADGNIIRATNGDVIAHLGYGESTAASGTANQPYTTLGIRKTTSTPYSASSTYNVGDICLYNEKVYVCKTAITTAEAWTSSHWQLVIGGNSTAEGKNNIASGVLSHAEGGGTIALGADSHSEGMMLQGNTYTIASGEGAHAEGGGTVASGRYAHSEGTRTQATANASHAQNTGTIAASPDQTAIGFFNVKDSNSVYALIVGNGTADNDRKNIGVLEWTGNLRIKGDVYAGCNDDSTGGAKLSRITGIKGDKEDHYTTSGNYNITPAGIGAVSLSDKYTRSSVGDLGWTSQTDGDAKVIAKSALAFWNGAYSGNGSNLSKCSTGNIIGSNGGTMTGQLLTSFKTSVAMGSYGSAQATVNGLAEEVRFSSGCAGSTNITTAYTKDGVTIPTGWYNFMYMPHRSGGKNGAADGDNAQYGNLFLFGMNNTNGRFVVRVTSGAIAEVVKLVTTADIATSTGTTSITTTGGSLVTHSIARNGKMRTLFLRVKNSSAINAGSNVYTGTIATASDRPAVWANGLGYYNGAAIMFQIKDDGAITARNTAQQLPANGEVYASLTYVVK